MGIVFKNNAKTTLASSLSNSATSATVTDGSVFPSLSSGEFFLITFDDGTNNEICKCTARSGNTLTIVRAQESTTARAFSSGDSAEGRVTAGVLEQIQENIAAKSANQTVFNTTTAGGATTYNIGTNPGVEANAMVFLNGVLQHHDTLSFSGTNLTFDAAPPNGMALEVIIDNLINLQSSNLTVDSFTAADVSGSPQTDFTLSDTPAAETNLIVFVDGVFQDQDAYTISSNTLTITTGVIAGRGVTVYVINPVNIGTPSDSTVTSAKLSGNITMPGNLIVGSNDVAFDSPTFVVDNANSRVGLGTASPSVPVDIVGDVKMSANLTVDTNTLVVDSSNNRVGVGTASPDVTFEIADTNAYMHIDATNHAAVFIDRASTSYHNNVFYQTADTTNWRIGQMGADNILQVRDEVNDNSNIMVWKHGGNVGIGTASPSSRLHIFDGGSSVNNQITFGNPSATHNAIIHHTAAGSEFLNIECKGTTSGYGNIVFKTGGTPDESMRIDASGNVGIGINPAGYGKLTVSGTGVLAALRASSGAGQLGFYEGGAGRFYLKTLNGADGLSFIDGDGTTERARIDADGTLLINTTVTSTSSSNHDFLRIGANFGYNQAASFNMNGYDDFGALYCDTGGTGVFGKLGQNAAVLSSGMYNYTSASGKPIYFYVDGSYRCQINSTSSGTLGSSDVKFKKDIKDIDYGLDTVKALKPRKFKWKVNEQESIGFIAQEVEKVISEVVHDSEGGADGAEPAGKSLDYAVLTSILTKAIQELSAELDAAKDRIEALEG